MNIAELLAENKRLQADNEQLRRENLQLRYEKAALEKRVARLEAELQALRELLETTSRQGKRQAAPFSKGAAKAQPKAPRQKPGDPAVHRPGPDHVDRI